MCDLLYDKKSYQTQQNAPNYEMGIDICNFLDYYGVFNDVE